MIAPGSISAEEITTIVSGHPGGILLASLAETVDRKFGRSATFHSSMLTGVVFEDMLLFLSARGKLVIEGDVIFPCGSLDC